MNFDKEHVIGIVGGMGPLAGLALFNRITVLTRATKDQDHLPVIMMSFPGYIADRTAFLEGQSEINPAFSIAAIIEKLETAGASVVGLACNTAYAPEIYDVIIAQLKKQNSQVSLVNMPLETCRLVRLNYPHVRRVGIMATNGSYRFSTYPKILQEEGYEVILPDKTFQQNIVHRAIYDQKIGIKSNAREITGEVLLLIDETIDYFRKKGVELIILGCTEFSFVPIVDRVKDIVIVDSTESLARALIRHAAELK